MADEIALNRAAERSARAQRLLEDELLEAQVALHGPSPFEARRASRL